MTDFVVRLVPGFSKALSKKGAIQCLEISSLDLMLRKERGSSDGNFRGPLRELQEKIDSSRSYSKNGEKDKTPFIEIEYTGRKQSLREWLKSRGFVRGILSIPVGKSIIPDEASMKFSVVNACGEVEFLKISGYDVDDIVLNNSVSKLTWMANPWQSSYRYQPMGEEKFNEEIRKLKENHKQRLSEKKED